MFSNLSWYEVVALLLLALFIFGDKLPQVIVSGLRMLRNLRRVAQNATSDLSRELGTDIQLDDLNPRTFVRKHVLSEADQEKLLKPLKGVSEDVMQQTRGLESDIRDVGRRAEQAAGDVQEAATLRNNGSSSRASVGRGARAGSSGAAPPAAPAAEVAAAEAAAAEVAAGAEPPAPAPAPGYDDVT